LSATPPNGGFGSEQAQVGVRSRHVHARMSADLLECALHERRAPHVNGMRAPTAADSQLEAGLSRIRAQLLELISASVGIAGDAPGSPLDEEHEDALLEAANGLGRVEAHLRGGAPAR
jgi:hypothetical protein